MGKMNAGGKKNLVMEYYRHIDREKMQFDFICDSDSEAIPKIEIEKLGGRVYKIRPYQSILGNIMDIYKLCKKNKYSVIHSYNSTMSVFSMFAGKMADVPVRISESLSMAHEEDWKTILKKILRPMSKWFANYYLACGEECGRWQFGNRLFDAGRVDVFKTAIDVNFNTYNEELRKKVRREFGWEDKIVIGHIGRFTVQKNSVQVIKIFDAFAKKEPNAVLCLIGDGELKNEVLAKVMDLGIEKKVYYLGEREDIQQFYNAMDAFLLPSLYEGLPMVGLEAECFGLPVFFSTEISREASVCELGHFLRLNVSEEYWADVMIKEVKKNMFVRKSRQKEVKEAGCDSVSEAIRLQDYYLGAIEREKDKIKYD